MALERLEHWIDNRQSAGKYTFLRQNVIKETGLSSEAAKKALQRQQKRGRIAKAKNHFFVIVPLEYASAGAPPATWFIDRLMDAMQQPYYVALLSAASQYGASHHAPQEFQVMTDRYVRPIEVGRVRIRFFTNKQIRRLPVSDVKTPTGRMKISTVEATAMDLLRHSKSAGHLDHVATVIAELSETFDSKRLIETLEAYDDVPNAQRLGYILEKLDQGKLATKIRAWVDRKHPTIVPLRTGRSPAGAPINEGWHLIVDRPLELDD